MQGFNYCLGKNARIQTLLVWSLLIGLVGFASVASAQPETFGGNPDYSGFIRIPSDTDDWTRHFRLGAVVGMNINADFSLKGPFNINHPPGVYDDGYVHPDSTGSSTSTTYWGDKNDSQYDATAQTVTMHSTTSFDTSGKANSSGGPFAGIEMAYGDNLWYWKHARVGWELGFGLLPMSFSDSQTLSASANQTAFVFNANPYNVSGLTNPGVHQGTYGGPGYLLAATPESYSSSTTNVTVTGTRTLDVMFYTLRLGPTFYWDLGDSVSISLGVGPAVGLVSGEYKYDETLTGGARNVGSFGATDFTYGGYVNGTLMYHITDLDGHNADVYVGAQYMPMGDATFSSGGREGRLNLSGQLYLSAGINWPF